MRQQYYRLKSRNLSVRMICFVFHHDWSSTWNSSDEICWWNWIMIWNEKLIWSKFSLFRKTGTIKKFNFLHHDFLLNFKNFLSSHINIMDSSHDSENEDIHVNKKNPETTMNEIRQSWEYSRDANESAHKTIDKGEEHSKTRHDWRWRGKSYYVTQNWGNWSINIIWR